MTQIKISDPSLLDDLVSALRKRPDAIVETSGADMITVHVIGSYGSEGHRATVERRLRAWEAQQLAHGRKVAVVIASPLPDTLR